MKLVEGGVTAPRGFLASSTNCGIKRGGRHDLALLFSEVPAKCAGLFTTNRIKSGSVVYTERLVRRGKAQAIIVNSGNANCCVGRQGIKDAEVIARSVARILGLDSCRVLIASTGIIGRLLPVAKIKDRIGVLASNLTRPNGEKFARAIMTTDTVHKELAVRVNIKGKEIIIGGAAKGSGMISPRMATMLAFCTTDAAVEKNALRVAFRESVGNSFNNIIVDGDMSTNDSAIIFANGMAGNPSIKKGSVEYSIFLEALNFITKELARKIVLDGEGATKFVEITVKRAGDFKAAEKIARHIANSNLIKTMIAGGDPNWGRVAASLGSSGVRFAEDRVDIYFDNKLVVKNGVGINVARRTLVRAFKRKNIKILIDLKSGRGTASIWTCDLTEEYVKINSEYEI